MRVNRIYGFALGGAGRLLYWLKNLDCCYLVFPNNLEIYLELLVRDQPQLILGLGMYSGLGENKILVGTPGSKRLPDDKHFLKPNSLMRYAETSDRLPVNRIGGKIGLLINQQRLHSCYTFLYIPKNMKPQIAIQTIEGVLQKFR